MTTEFFLKGGTINPWISAAGLALFAVAMWVRLVAMRTLGRFWSLHVELREGHQLIREGIYSYIRHPVYAAIVLEFLGMNLVANAYWTLLATFVLYFPLLALRLVQEEQALVEKLGEDYLRYRREVPALWPFRSRAS
jgi:protein-S-isoprenylcysteine O-methyltransferase Ste14